MAAGMNPQGRERNWNERPSSSSQILTLRRSRIRNSTATFFSSAYLVTVRITLFSCVWRSLASLSTTARALSVASWILAPLSQSVQACYIETNMGLSGRGTAAASISLSMTLPRRLRAGVFSGAGESSSEALRTRQISGCKNNNKKTL